MYLNNCSVLTDNIKNRAIVMGHILVVYKRIQATFCTDQAISLGFTLDWGPNVISVHVFCNYTVDFFLFNISVSYKVIDKVLLKICSPTKVIFYIYCDLIKKVGGEKF